MSPYTTMATQVWKPRPDSAIGNLSLNLATHYLRAPKPGVHESVLDGRARFLEFLNVTKDGDGDIIDLGHLSSAIHLQIPNLSEAMRQVIRPTPYLRERIDSAFERIKSCVAGFHVRMGTAATDSERFAYFPTASLRAVDAMIEVALELDAPVFIISDSVSTRDYFMSKVPKAVSTGFDIGFTADEHHQSVWNSTRDETEREKENSYVEWFLLSRMPMVYTTMGGVIGRNMVDEMASEGISSTFGYSAAVYGGICPYYVFNDGYVFLPNGRSRPNFRYAWSDTSTGRYIYLKHNTPEQFMLAMKIAPMWRVACDEELDKQYMNVVKTSEAKDARRVARFERALVESDGSTLRNWSSTQIEQTFT